VGKLSWWWFSHYLISYLVYRIKLWSNQKQQNSSLKLNVCICYQRNKPYKKMIVHLSHLRYLCSQTPSSQQQLNNKRQKPNKKELSRRRKKALVVVSGVRTSQKNTSWAIVACPVDVFWLKEKKLSSGCQLQLTARWQPGDSFTARRNQ